MGTQDNALWTPLWVMWSDTPSLIARMLTLLWLEILKNKMLREALCWMKHPGLGTSVYKTSDFFLALSLRVMIVSLASHSACGFSSYILALLQGMTHCLVPGTWEKVTPRGTRLGRAHFQCGCLTAFLSALLLRGKSKREKSQRGLTFRFWPHSIPRRFFALTYYKQKWVSSCHFPTE